MYLSMCGVGVGVDVDGGGLVVTMGHGCGQH